VNWFLIYLYFSCVAVFASSFSNNAMRAVILTLIVIFMSMATMVMTASVIKEFQDLLPVNHIQMEMPWPFIRKLFTGCLVLLISLLLFFSFSNYTHGEVSSRQRWLYPLIFLASVGGCFALFFHTVLRIVL
jgi:hypothetical protein